MGGGLMQLVAYGAQDIYLTGNPQITFFKVVYRRHTNFSMEAIEQTVNGSQSSGGSGTVTISRNGDLVHKVYLTTKSANVNRGSNIFSEVELEIGGQRIDRHYTDWCNVWNELSTDESKALGLKSMQGDIGLSVAHDSANANTSSGTLNLVQVPLQFWFCRNIGLALPLIALQYHEVKLKIQWGTGAEVTSTGNNLEDCGVICDYIYLDTDERRRFAQVSHEYLIEQVQRHQVSGLSTTASANASERLNFNHPVKELIWSYPRRNVVDNVQLKLNGHDRFSVQPEPYFTVRQPFEYHTAVPHQNLPTAARVTDVAKSNGLVAINGSAAGDVTATDFTAQNGAASGDTQFNIASGVLTIGVTSLAITNVSFEGGPSAGAGGVGIPVGTTLAILCTGSDAGTGADPGTQGTLGNIYFATTTGLPSAGTTNVININITTPTAADGTILDETDIGATPATFRVFASEGSTRDEARTSRMTRKVGVYTFALKPEEHQPSGSCNFSRIDNAQLNFHHNGFLDADEMTVYAVNYNVLRIMSGMGGLAYSN